MVKSDDLCVVRVPIFQGLSRDEQARVAEFANPMRVAKGDLVSMPGQDDSRLFVMHTGQLKVSHVTADGQEQILRTVREGDVVGERAFLTGQSADDTVVALEDSQMCVFDHTDLKSLLREYPDISERMLLTLSDRLFSTERLLAAVTSSDVRARVAAYLLDLPSAANDGVQELMLPMAKHEVAAYLGTTPETLSRRLAALAAEGVIALSGRRGVTIVDRTMLEEIATPQ